MRVTMLRRSTGAAGGAARGRAAAGGGALAASWPWSPPWPSIGAVRLRGLPTPVLVELAAAGTLGEHVHLVAARLATGRPGRARTASAPTAVTQVVARRRLSRAG